MEVAIHPYSRKVGGTFSAPGDSGSIVVDGKGGIVGVIIDGAGQADSTDVTYLSPYYWIWEHIKAVFPDATSTRIRLGNLLQQYPSRDLVQCRYRNLP